MSGYYDREGNPIGIDRWGELMEDESYRRIGLQHFEGDIKVSTVWMGLDYSFGLHGDPIIFETMIFSANDRYPYGNAQMRYGTEQAAAEGHRRVCEDIERGRRPWFLDEEDE